VFARLANEANMQAKKPGALVGRGSYTITEWCAYRNISRSAYYLLRKAGCAPRVHYIGTAPRISVEADRDWLAAREAQAAAA